MAANTSTGAITRRLETPAARMAVISPSLAMRHRGHGQGKQRDYGFERRVAAAYQHFKQLVDALQEDDTRGQQRAEHRAREDLAKNVTADQAQ
jgi:hypothetical protein